MKKYIVAVDVGSSEVVVAVGSVADDGMMNIEAIAPYEMTLATSPSIRPKG